MNILFKLQVVVEYKESRNLSFETIYIVFAFNLNKNTKPLKIFIFFTKMIESQNLRIALGISHKLK